MAGPTPARRHLALLQAWHAWIAGGFLVAYLTADEDTYGMHQFAGYAVVAAIVLRLAVGLLFASPSPLSLPRPSWRVARQWLATRKGRHPLFAWFAACLLLAVGLAALSGVLADGIGQLEHPHEAIAEFSLWLIVGHIVFVTWMHGARKWLARLRSRAPAAPAESSESASSAGARGKRSMNRRLLIGVTALSLLPFIALATDPRRNALLAEYEADARRADPAFTSFSAQRGEALFRTRSTVGDSRTPSCTACHTTDPRQQGRNAKTGRPIDPVAVSVEPKRFTDKATVEKQFARDCRSVLGRDCTALEKGDYVTFMIGQ